MPKIIPVDSVRMRFDVKPKVKVLPRKKKNRYISSAEICDMFLYLPSESSSLSLINSRQQDHHQQIEEAAIFDSGVPVMDRMMLQLAIRYRVLDNQFLDTQYDEHHDLELDLPLQAGLGLLNPHELVSHSLIDNSKLTRRILS